MGKGSPHVAAVKRLLPIPIVTKRGQPSWYRVGDLWKAARGICSNPDRFDELGFPLGLLAELKERSEFPDQG